jgi:hypothetical protein
MLVGRGRGCLRCGPLGEDHFMSRPPNFSVEPTGAALAVSGVLAEFGCLRLTRGARLSVRLTSTLGGIARELMWWKSQNLDKPVRGTDGLTWNFRVWHDVVDGAHTERIFFWDDSREFTGCAEFAGD